MSTICYPAFRGQIEITAANDTVKWEDNGGLQTIFLPQAVYTQSQLFLFLTLAMNAAFANSYDVSVDFEGKVVVQGATPWRPDLTSGFPNFWTGGALLAGTKFDNHMGWSVDPIALPMQNVHTSPDVISRSFFPDQPLQEDDEFIPQSTVAEFWSIGGLGYAYDFTGKTVAADIRNLAFRLLSSDKKIEYTEAFWRVYAKQGSPNGRFEFYEDRTITTSQLYVLTGESLSRVAWSRSIQGHPYWSLPLSMRRYIP